MKLRNLKAAIRKVKGAVHVEMRLPNCSETVRIGLLKGQLIDALDLLYEAGTDETDLTITGDMLVVASWPRTVFEAEPGSHHAAAAVSGSTAAPGEIAERDEGENSDADDLEDILG